MQATSSSLNTLWHHPQQTFGLNLRCSLPVFCFVLVLFLKAQRLSPTRRPEKLSASFSTSANFLQSPAGCDRVFGCGHSWLRGRPMIWSDTKWVPKCQSSHGRKSFKLWTDPADRDFLRDRLLDAASLGLSCWTVEKRSISALTSRGQDPLDASFFLLFKATQPRASPKEAEINFWWLTREKSVNYPLQLYDKPHIPRRDMLSL